MVIPCIDLLGGKVVQLVQGREKALEGDAPLTMLDKFAGFPIIQVIDLDAAMGTGSNDHIVRLLASRAVTRVGGGIRSAARARAVVDAGASRVIVGTAAFGDTGIQSEFLEGLATTVGRERVVVALDSKGGRIVVRGWQRATDLEAEAVIRELEPFCSGFLCTYVDKEGMMQGTDLDWYRRLRGSTEHELTAAGGITTVEEIDELTRMGVHAALGMAVYTGRLDLADLRRRYPGP